MRRLAVALALLGLAPAALAFDFEPLKPLDTREVDPAMLKGAFGAYEIRDKAGRKRCRILLTQQQAIGGYAVELAPDCAKAFPVMADIAGWRLLEGWTIDLIDPLRKTRVRFRRRTSAMFHLVTLRTLLAWTSCANCPMLRRSLVAEQSHDPGHPVADRRRVDRFGSGATAQRQCEKRARLVGVFHPRA